ncbi:MAG: hypothetical protein N2D54_00370, partial [Chloroflexota bacterium]
MAQSIITKSDYQKALDQVVYYKEPNLGFLKITGPDRLDFIQRQSTNDMNELQDGGVITTVLTSSIARVVDVLQLFQIGEDYYIMTLSGHGKSTSDFLTSKIFFMDKVVIANLADDYAKIILEGPKSGKLIKQLGIVNPPQKNHFLIAKTNNIEIKLVAHEGLGSEIGYSILLPKSAQTDFLELLHKQDITELSTQTREILRVEAIQPGPRAELVQDYTPLEANLGWAISDSKGCYTGQEVIARQITYDKVNKRLVLIQAEEKMNAGATIRAEGKNVGKITSA